MQAKRQIGDSNTGQTQSGHFWFSNILTYGPRLYSLFGPKSIARIRLKFHETEFGVTETIRKRASNFACLLAHVPVWF